MSVLQLVPSHFLRKWRQAASNSKGELQPFTISGVVAHILREHGMIYEEDRIIEHIALWESVAKIRSELDFFAPIAQYPGFIAELQWLFRQMDLGEPVLENIPPLGRREVERLHEAYHLRLEQSGILDQPAQIKRAVELIPTSSVLTGVERIELIGLGELSPLERRFTDKLIQGHTVERIRPTATNAQIKVTAARDPFQEVEEIATRVRSCLEEGTSPERIAVAFPNPASYLPIIMPVFHKMQIPWTMPAQSLRNLPIAKAVLSLLGGEIEGWHKHHLQLLTVPGWGFPFELNNEEYRALNFAPPLKGLPAWREHLGSYPGWEKVFIMLAETAQNIAVQPLAQHAINLQRVLLEFAPTAWETSTADQWAVLLKSWDALFLILENLSQSDCQVSPEDFVLLLQTLFESYQIRDRRTFADRMTILSTEQLGAHTFEHLYVGGLVQGQFPPERRAHWLTKLKAEADAESLLKAVTESAEQVSLFYPKTDREGKLNLPSAIIPQSQEELAPVETAARKGPALRISTGVLHDERIVERIRKKILKNGLSTSLLNMYARCPYQFFCTYVLELQPDEEETLELTARDEGTIIHRVLQKFWENHIEGPIPTVEEGQAEVEGLLRLEYEKLRRQIPERILTNLRRFIRQDLSVTTQEFRPAFLERTFRGLEIPLPEGVVELHGVIDRIDRNSNGDYVLYDYKTGSAPFLKDIQEGNDVQIATYLLAAADMFPEASNVGAAYYLTKDGKRVGVYHRDHIRSLNVRAGKGTLDDDQFTAQIDFFYEVIRDLVGKIMNAEFPAEPSSGRVCAYCPYQGISRREVLK